MFKYLSDFKFCCIAVLVKNRVGLELEKTYNYLRPFSEESEHRVCLQVLNFIFTLTSGHIPKSHEKVTGQDLKIKTQILQHTLMN